MTVRRLLLAFALVSPLILVASWRYSVPAALGQMLLSHLLVLYATLRPNVQWLGEVVTCFETDRREVWLTIDDGPSSDTRAILEVLARHSVQATFFVKGSLALQNRADVEAILADGHSVANHSFSHPSGTFWCLPPQRIAAEIDQGNAALESISGAPQRWFRAPVGMKNPAVHPALRKRNMRLIGWTVRGFDAVLTDANEIIGRIVHRLRPGAIIVLHQGRKHSASVIEKVIVALRERGYAFVVPDDSRLKTSM
ncbi:MAG: polysaccharide deacetylase family protein [Thermoanaerobaculia bacterium]